MSDIPESSPSPSAMAETYGVIPSGGFGTSGGSSTIPPSNAGDDSSSSDTVATRALVLYLRSEADAADDRARRLRSMAEAIGREIGNTNGLGMCQIGSDATVADAADMAPLDEFGLPKYKGRKRGRKPKKRKRQRRPDAPKRQHTGYTLFMQENYPAAKAANPSMRSKDIIAIVARQWKECDSARKKAWKDRSKAINEISMKAEEETASVEVGEDEEQEGEDEEEDDDDDDVDAEDEEEEGDEEEENNVREVSSAVSAEDNNNPPPPPLEGFVHQRDPAAGGSEGNDEEESATKRQAFRKRDV